MAIRFEPLSNANLEAAKAFNVRLKQSGRVPFLLRESLPSSNLEEGVIHARNYLAMEGDVARGGYMTVDYPSLLNGESLTVTNVQSPLSQSIFDNRYAMAPIQMVKQFLRHNPLCFVVGMGQQSNPLPRLLRASGWSVEPVPFFFRIHRPVRFLTGMPVLRSRWYKRVAASMAAYSGGGAVAAKLFQRSRVPLTREFSARREENWGDWAAEVWAEFSASTRFAVRRELSVLRELYSATPRLRIHRVLRGEVTIGWSASFLTQMQNNSYFGNLLVGTILDCVARPDSLSHVAALADRAIAQEGADMVITNQSLSSWREAFSNAGFRSGPSIFQAALSPALTRVLSKKPVGDGIVHITRGDGDGRLHV